MVEPTAHNGRVVGSSPAPTTTFEVYMFEIYGRDNCIWCDRAKALLDSKGLQYNFHNIETDSKRRAEFNFIFRDAKTVPQICTGMYDEVQFIGGYTDLVGYLAQR